MEKIDCLSYSAIHREVLRLAIPSIFASVTVPLVGVVDTAIVGHLADAAAIGGFAIGSMLFGLMYWCFGFLRIGTSGMVAQAYGRRDIQTQSNIFFQSVLFAVSGAAFLLLVQWPFYTAVMAIVPCSDAVRAFTHDYFFIRIWAAPATLLLMTFKGFFIGEQNALASLVLDLTVNVVNILASIVLALCTPMGVTGVIYGTLIAQYSGLVVALIVMIVRYRPIVAALNRHALVRWDEMRQLVALNSNLIIRSLCFIGVYIGFTALASGYGDVELAVSSIMMQLFMLFSYFVDGFAYAAEALVGRFIGANQPRQVRQTTHCVFAWGAVIAVCFTLLFLFFSLPMVRVFTSDAVVIACSRRYYGWLLVMPVLSCIAFIWDGILVGATEGKTLRNVMIGALVSFVVTYYALFSFVGIQALYAAYMAHLLFRSVYLTAFWWHNKRLRPNI